MIPVVSSIRKDADLSKMKLLVLAFCVCAASAASFGTYKPWQPQQQVTQAVAQVVQTPFVPEYKTYVPKSYVTKPVAPVVSIVPKPVIPKVPVAPVPVAKTVYSGKEGDSAILRADSEVTDNGFNYFYETSNGISAQSTGTLKRVDDSDVIAVQGSYRYTAPDGTPIVFSYVADENGYQPQSDSIPVGPAIPEAIARSLEYLRAHPPKEHY